MDGEPQEGTAKLFDAENHLVAEAAFGGDTVQMHVKDAHLWNAEEPYLYTLVLETAGEVITDHVGIREIHAKDGVLYLNGVKIKFHGTNRHDSDPVTGFAISLAQIKKRSEGNERAQHQCDPDQPLPECAVLLSAL